MHLNMAQDGDIIHVGPGTYYENIEVLKEVTIVSQSGASETVIDAAGSGTVVKINQHSTSEYYGYPEIHKDVILDGFTIQNGNSTSSTDPSGGIIIGVSNSVIKNCIIRNNTSNDGGGAFF